VFTAQNELDLKTKFRLITVLNPYRTKLNPICNWGNLGSYLSVYTQLYQTQISSVPNTVISVRFKTVTPNLMTVSILTTFYDQGIDNKQSVSPTNKSSDQ
jgi:hypothetical protein